MILANFNRSSYYSFILISLVVTGCTERSASHLAIDDTIAAETVITASARTTSEQQINQSLGRLRFRQTKDNPKVPETPQLSEQSSATASAIAKTAVARRSNSVWERMFAMFALPEVDHPRVTQELEKFLRHPDSLIALQKRAEPYLYLILDELEAKNLPGELALLPVIESSFRVNAYSHADAAGLWQFTPATAVTFGLKQNWWYDGRRDVSASTEAATEYLRKLHERFDGDWFLALASYNVGAGNVQKAIKKNSQHALDTSFWSLDLPEETKAYVPKLLAIAKLFAHADAYNMPLQPIPNEPFFKAVHIDSQLDLSKAAELAGMPLDEFFNLNPAFNRAITAPDGDYQLLVKTENVASFKRNLANLPKSEHVKWYEHTIQAGEDLESIAKLHKMPIQAIIEINQLTDNYLAVGNILRIPPKSVRGFVKA
jgi:membrane-bound lytic murein transglycosylase D